VDTVSYAFRGSSFDRACDGFRAKPHRYGPGGAIVADGRGPDGGRFLCYPAFGVLAVETRLGALLAGDADDHSLASASSIDTGAKNARLMLWEHLDVDPGHPSEVRRYDLASELRFGVAANGLAFLRSVGGMIPARSRGTLEVAADGSVMTAYVRTAKRGVVHARIYDKGRESGSDPPGLRVRIESQNRPAKAKRYSPHVLAEIDHSTTFGRTMSPYLNADELLVAGADGAVGELAARAIRGELSHTKAERLIGSVALLKFGGRAVYDRDGGSRKTNDKRSSIRLRALREAGIVLDRALPPEATVPTSALLRDAIERFTA
jgi:hypothetical protein